MNRAARRGHARVRQAIAGRPLAEPPMWVRSGCDPEHPRPEVTRELFSAYYEAPRVEVRNRNGRITQPGRPVQVRFCGPLGAPRHIDDPAVLRAEARRLLDVAATLEALGAALDELGPGGDGLARDRSTSSPASSARE